MLLLAGIDRLDTDLTVGQMQGETTWDINYSTNIPMTIVCVYSLYSLCKHERLNSEFLLSAGKFQMQVLPQCGHAVQEDTPDRVAEVLATFLLRHKLATPKAEFHRYVQFCAPAGQCWVL